LRRGASCFARAGVVDGFSSVVALFLVGVDAVTAGGSLAGAGVTPVGILVAAFVPCVAAPLRVVAGASDGSVAPPAATQAYQPPTSGRTFVKP
jgi:hypothetical protein